MPVQLADGTHRSQLVDFEPSFIPDVLAAPWRDRLATAPAGSGESAARDRDRDLKLLAWVEYGETLAEGGSCLLPVIPDRVQCIMLKIYLATRPKTTKTRQAAIAG